VKSHQDIDRRSLLLHRLVSGKLLRNPALVERFRATIRECFQWRWMITGARGSLPEN
jgi:hypothetical protein